jgi:ABC-type multidrug transport system fused ATPase/permease subunit
VRGALQRLLVYLRPYRWSLVAVFALVIIGALAELAGPILMGLAIDRFIAEGDAAGLLRLIAAMVAVYAIAWLAQTIQGRTMATTAQKALLVLRRDLFDHLQTLSLAFFDRHPHG